MVLQLEVIFLSSCFLGLFFPLVLHLARVSVTAVNERRCGDPTEVTRDVKLLQGGTSIHPIV